MAVQLFPLTPARQPIRRGLPLLAVFTLLLPAGVARAADPPATRPGQADATALLAEADGLLANDRQNRDGVQSSSLADDIDGARRRAAVLALVPAGGKPDWGRLGLERSAGGKDAQLAVTLAVRAGDVEGALAAAGRVPDRVTRCVCLLYVPEAMAAAGDVDGARVLLAPYAGAGWPPEYFDSFHMAAAVALARAGDAAGAVVEAERVVDPNLGELAMSEAAAVLRAKGDKAGAARVIEGVRKMADAAAADADRRRTRLAAWIADRRRTWLATELADAGDTAPLEKIVAAMSDTDRDPNPAFPPGYPKARLMITLARKLYRAGRKDEAADMLKQADAIVDNKSKSEFVSLEAKSEVAKGYAAVGDDAGWSRLAGAADDRDYVLNGVVYELADAGDVDGAKKAVGRMRDRMGLLPWIAEAQAKKDGPAAAEAWARSLSNPSDRAAALLGVARYLIDRQIEQRPVVKAGAGAGAPVPTRPS